ncbi:hypothetical protein OPKNFCMD_5235 [Methylobacterium crusticola]|uniref:Uncharacterized protein n=2 Tax=Methylobacterium crusticola TaxID=1697972 RepID=A0ABQ4R4S9_9HYPH|nr:hypothetical protein [Methylobacterium crusticola]GJD52469.1 hypothetical protein OPKNFCMD_5235 [Methylobacterium crusticola]
MTDTKLLFLIVSPFAYLHVRFTVWQVRRDLDRSAWHHEVAEAYRERAGARLAIMESWQQPA